LPQFSGFVPQAPFSSNAFADEHVIATTNNPTK